MQSSEPIEPQLNDSSHAALGDESWRTEVATRVNSYRARRKRHGAEDNSPSLDFGPASAAPAFDAQNRSPQSYTVTNPAASRVAQPDTSQPVAESRSLARAAQNAFDTNYYRRLNAESRAQIPVPTTSAVCAIAATAQELAAEFATEFEARSEAGLPGDFQDAPPDQPCQESGNSPALDLEIRPAAAGDSVLDRYCISEPEPGLPVTPPVAPLAPPEQGNLIVFRRPLLEPPLVPLPSRDELAEPIHNRPRILEVPEDIMPPVQGSLFPEIRLDVDEQESSSLSEPKIEVPLPVAAISERMMAALADLGVVLAAGLLFGGMTWRTLPEIPHTKPFWMVLGAVTVLFWAVYQHLFLLYAGRTLGMSLRGIRLSTFDGRVPEWGQRSRRARSMFVSFAPVTLGFLWALVDEDELCWHDRISQTFPTSD
jgi:uncharacterized RDD family membrane protein YckC